MTPVQCYEARRLLGWKRLELAIRALCAEVTVRNLEEQRCRPRPSTIAALRTALEEAGIEFVREPQGLARVKLRDQRGTMLSSCREHPG
ncbi:helix-turn-helix domain-containing protein [Muricoccus pecuniae]|uniref:Transcriptional regulator with XRE-family HTH domain n=1 Tax=Muricoccus pecuniae TaxID=693023 RepID=A0A840Y0U5_9PROT|nr:transcriptional regulator with XRE-family HTH domain [Roseomonas pecuniae]